MKKVLVVGGGAAGMMAAIMAAREGASVELFEKNEKLGKKIFITGKGRGNLTNAADMETIRDSICSNPKFMFSAFKNFTNGDCLELFHELGLKTKVERGDRVFPESDHAYEITDVLAKELRRLKVRINLFTEIKEIIEYKGEFQGIIDAKGNKHEADAVIIATGGLSYKSTGSTGDGMKFASKLGLEVTETSPSLVPFNCKEDFVRDMQGLSLKNTALSLTAGKKEVYSDFGEMLFTHFGVSGPMILSASARTNRKYFKNELIIHLDLKPALNDEQLDARLIREFEENRKKEFKNSLSKLFPSKMIPVMIKRSGINGNKKCAEISHAERMKLKELIKDFTMTVTGLRSYEEAIITKGGVSVKELNPSTMESKKIKGLYFAGETIDVDCVTGGFNLQVAWSTGVLAGQNAGRV
ncbi:MAG: NAD(P)/FAD-dependent oxidoreductase [Lachnospiraceae bacterium]|nr:NAD(P)/FAD-dependent oxidoreductase [Lachnospiraceae bacterium]